MWIILFALTLLYAALAHADTPSANGSAKTNPYINSDAIPTKSTTTLPLIQPSFVIEPADPAQYNEPAHCNILSTITLSQIAKITTPVDIGNTGSLPPIIVEPGVTLSPLIIEYCDGRVFIKPYTVTEGHK